MFVITFTSYLSHLNILLLQLVLTQRVCAVDSSVRVGNAHVECIHIYGDPRSSTGLGSKFSQVFALELLPVGQEEFLKFQLCHFPYTEMYNW
ncbi:hypothetical protein C0J52_02080 [Blattella germanica]|nr:hypothetical protein C0J52_02080 [Blattella germanica]